MSKEPIVNIDLQPIADVVNNLIDKLYNAAGWVITPRGQRKYELEAQMYLIEEIKKNELLSLLEKASIISNCKKIINEYKNQNDIIHLVVQQLTEDANPSGIENDWLLYFMDKSRNVQDMSIKQLWANIFVKECENNGLVTKRLINLLELMSVNEAEAFQRLIPFQMRIGENYSDGMPMIFIFDIDDKIFSDVELDSSDLLLLDNIGLISSIRKYTYDYSYTKSDCVTLHYFDQKIVVKTKNKKINGGIVSLTSEGRILAASLECRRVNNFVDYVIDRIKENCEVCSIEKY